MPDEVKKPLWERIVEVIDHNRYLATAIVGVLVISSYMIGCQPTTTSPFSGQSVGRSQLAIEAEAWLAKSTAELESMEARLQLANLDLDEQEQLREDILAWTQNLANSVPGLGAYLPFIFGSGGILAAFGIGADNRRKDKVIRTLKNGKT